MSEYKKYIQNVILSPTLSPTNSSEPYNPARRDKATKVSRSKDQKNKLHNVRSKEVFLTDTQASDETKSSNYCAQSNPDTTQSLQEIIKKLKKQNNDLKQQIIQAKSNQFFNISESKLKDLIEQNEKLKDKVQKIKKALDDSYIERDFLERFNKNLKSQCQQMTREIVKLNKQFTNKTCDREISGEKDLSKSLKHDQNQNRIQRYSVKRLQEMNRARGSHRSQQKQDRLSYRPKDESKAKTKQIQRMLKKSRSTSRIIDNQYFIGKGTKQLQRNRRAKRKEEN